MTIRLSLLLIMGLLMVPGVSVKAGFEAGHESIQSPTPPPPPTPQAGETGPQQAGPPQQKDEPIRLSSQLILVPVSASDPAGRPVKDLTAEDFVLEEEGHPQRIIALGEPGKTPLEIALLFDVSLSVEAQFAFEQQAAIRFLKEVLKPKDGVVVFSIGLTPKLVKERTTNLDQAVRGVISIQPMKEPTALFDSVIDAAHYLDKSVDGGSRRVLVVISDGEENNSRAHKVRGGEELTPLSVVLRELQMKDCVFYSINPSGSGIFMNKISTRGQKVMEAMSSNTGGKAFLPDKIEDLDAVFKQIIEELQSQYLFGYYSTDDREDGGFRRITVRTPKRADLRVRARQGYYARKS